MFDLDLLNGTIDTGDSWRVLDLRDHIHAVQHLAEHNVLTIEPRARHGGNEELRAVGVRAGVSHRKEAGAGVLELEVLVGEARAVDALAASAIAAGEIGSTRSEREKHAFKELAYRHPGS